MSHEPVVVMNRECLTVAQAMTIRVALESFDMSLAHDGLGDDEHGRRMTEAYRANIAAIRDVMYLVEKGRTEAK